MHAESDTSDLSVVPEFRSAPTDLVTRPGAEVTLPCEVSGHPEPVVFWTAAGRDRAMLPGGSYGPVTVHHNGTLHIKVGTHRAPSRPPSSERRHVTEIRGACQIAAIRALLWPVTSQIRATDRSESQAIY